MPRIIGLAAATAVALATGWAGAARADDIIPYPSTGTENPVVYSFTAASTGDIDAYFVGRGGASFDETLAMFVNGVLSSNGFGLDNQTSAVGDVFDLGSVTAGDKIVFAVSVNDPPLSPPYVFSDPTLNGPYDFGTAGGGLNHIYSTPYTANPAIGSIPKGTYVGFEDIPGSDGPDFNYTDEQYVFTNLSTHTNTPEPASLALLGSGLLALVALRRRG